MTTYPLSDEDRAIQQRARSVRRRRADPVGRARRGQRGAHPRRGTSQASRAGDRARPVRDEHARRARRHRHDHAAAGARERADRPRHERARLVRAHPARVGAGGRERAPDEHMDPAVDPRRAARVLRDHRGGRRQRRRRDRGHRPPRRRRVRARRREDARDLVQQRELLLLPGEDRRRAERGRARDVLRRQGHARRAARARAGVHPHVPRHARRGGVRRRACAGREPRRRRGRRHGVHVRVVPVRATDDRRAMLRRGRASDRRGDARSRKNACSSAARSSRTRRSRTCSPTRSPSCGRRGS